MTIKEAAEMAISVQNACNLSGVVRSFAKITEVLWEEANKQGKGTDWVNRHPVSVLFSSKINSLTGGDNEFSKAYKECMKIIEE